MIIEVLGSGCPTCKKLYELTKKATSEIDSKIEVKYLTGNEGMKKIIELGAMSSPVLTVNNKIAMTGFTSDISKIKVAILKTAKE
jgi:glutaredoxin